MFIKKLVKVFAVYKKIIKLKSENINGTMILMIYIKVLEPEQKYGKKKPILQLKRVERKRQKKDYREKLFLKVISLFSSFFLFNEYFYGLGYLPSFYILEFSKSFFELHSEMFYVLVVSLSIGIFIVGSS